MLYLITILTALMILRSRSITTSMVATVDWATHDNYLFDISVFGLAYEFTVFL